MPLLSPSPRRRVLLVVDNAAHPVSVVVRAADAGAEIVTCATAERAWSALRSGRRFSAVLASEREPSLAAAAAGAGTSMLSIRPDAALPELTAALSTVAVPVPRGDVPVAIGPSDALGPPPGGGADGELVAVCGPGGTGASTVAAALAAGLGAEPSRRSSGTLLADFALRADQAFIHGHEDTPAGLLQLVEASRYRPMTGFDVQRLTVGLATCRLLPGLRRPWHWTAVSPRAFDGVLMGLLGRFGLVVADISADFEGETDSGSCDVEERNHIARRTATAADIVVAVGGPGASGARRLELTVDDLLEQRVEPERIQPVVNRTTSLGLGVRRSAAHVCGLPVAPVALPAMAYPPDGPPPPGWGRPLIEAVAARLGLVGAPDRTLSLVPVAPGSLGCARR